MMKSWAEPCSKGLSAMKILIADDDDISREMLRHALESAGYETIEAEDGRSALALVEEGVARLVISDWDMPDLNGLELCRAIRQNDINGYVYVVLVTSHSGSSAIVEGMSAGADDFVSKPFDPLELVARVRAGERILNLETRDLVIFSLAKLAESRDTETGHHLERVQRYSRLLAQQLLRNPKFAGLIDPEFIRLIFLTSPLHDIGKVGIPDMVLLKPGRLSEAEFAIMKDHTVLGAQTLDAALDRYPDARFLKFARDIAAYHHERYDGSGYPYGLKGETIPLAARIVALADVYDALTSRRTYKPEFSHTITRAMIIQESGSHFDPDVVEAFLEVEQEFERIRAQFSAEAALSADGTRRFGDSPAARDSRAPVSCGAT